jgi:hypothetical protein
MRALADHYAETGQPEQALEIYQELCSKIMASNPDPQNDLLNSIYISRTPYFAPMLLRRMGRGQDENVLDMQKAFERAATPPCTRPQEP